MLSFGVSANTALSVSFPHPCRRASAESHLALRPALFGDLWVLVLPAPRRAEADARPGEAICVFFASVCCFLRV